MRSIAAVAFVLLLALPASAAGRERTVTLDVKDADARDVLKSMQKQCGIRNLIIDPDVKASGTFFLTDVPCRTAFKVVLRTMGLTSTTYSNAMVNVERKGR